MSFSLFCRNHVLSLISDWKSLKVCWQYPGLGSSMVRSNAIPAEIDRGNRMAFQLMDFQKRAFRQTPVLRHLRPALSVKALTTR